MKKNNFLEKDDILFLCDFLEQNADFEDDDIKKYYYKLVKKLEKML